jgi:curved DNA-binding protein CbpA
VANRDLEDLGWTDPYELLGVSPDAATADIERVYRRLVRRTHPDAGGDEASQKRLNLAREVLLNPDRRNDMDLRLPCRLSPIHSIGGGTRTTRRSRPRPRYSPWTSPDWVGAISRPSATRHAAGGYADEPKSLIIKCARRTNYRSAA